MPDFDDLAFDLRFALTHKTIGREAKKLIRSLPEDALATVRGTVIRAAFSCVGKPTQQYAFTRACRSRCWACGT